MPLVMRKIAVIAIAAIAIADAVIKTVLLVIIFFPPCKVSIYDFPTSYGAIIYDENENKMKVLMNF